MNLIQDMIGQALGQGGIQQIASKLGVDEATAQGGIEQALPMILGGIQRNTQSEEGAQAFYGAVERDHDGSIFANLNDHLNQPEAANGAGILGHVFGGQQEQVHQALGQQSGLNAGQAGNLMSMLAPLVMGALGQQRQGGGLDASGMANLLGGLNLGGGAQGGQGGGFAAVLGFLDQNKDGNVIDDVGKMLGGFLGGNK